jgi:cytochrome P450
MTDATDDWTPGRIAAKLASLGEEWSERNAVAQLYENTTKSSLERLTLEEMERSNASMTLAEKRARASKEYQAYVEKAVEARKEANKARVKYDVGNVWADHLRTQHATKREELRRLSGLSGTP